LSEVSWEFLPEYDVYSFKLRDIKYIDINTNKETILKETVEYEFDVSPEGKFVLHN
jgi:hypothetical protein